MPFRPVPKPLTVDVLVVGAGPAGLATACGLARCGVRVLAVDRHAGTTTFPKATGVRPRTLEILRTWRLEERVLAAAQPARIELGISEVLAGPLLSVDVLGAPDAADLARLSPSSMAIIPQDVLEPVLLQHAREHGADVRFKTSLVGFGLEARERGGPGVWARLRDAEGHERKVRARFLVAADGPRSPVRTDLGVEVEHLGAVETHVTALFQADLEGVAADPPFALHAVTLPGAEGVFVASGRGRWGYGWTVPPETDQAPSADTADRRIRAATGLPDLDPGVQGVFLWRFEAETATAYRRGPVFLVGDAATRTTPRRATGMNTGIAAAHNLSWKLAWVLHGWAGPALLDSYEEERLPVGRENAVRSLVPVTETGDELLAPDFGAVYTSRVVQPVSTPRGAGRSPVPVLPARLGVGAVPGSRAPHAWVGPRRRRRSTLDLFDGRLTVVTGAEGSAWCAAAQRLDEIDPAPLAALQLGVGEDPSGEVAAAFGLAPQDAVLVRPDGHVAWRSDADAPASGSVTDRLRAARDLALGR
jgi:putative polyketide hydroxylase